MAHKLLPFLLLSLSTALRAQVIITESAQWTVPAGVTQVTFELVGAGGNGAPNGGGGGGGGAYVRGTYTVSPGTNYSIVVGAGGSELATIVGGMGILAGAGSNGTTVANPNVGGGGAGGTALGGQAQHTGGAGGGGYWTYFGGGGGGAGGNNANGGAGGNAIVYNGSNCLYTGGSGGTSGGVWAGIGGKGAGFIDNTCTAANPAENGNAYGAGGGGGNGNSSPAALGCSGVCIITWSGMMGMEGIAGQAALPYSIWRNANHCTLQLHHASSTDMVELIDAQGRIIIKRSLASGSAQLNGDELPPGCYSVAITTSGQRFVERWVNAGY